MRFLTSFYYWNIYSFSYISSSNAALFTSLVIIDTTNYSRHTISRYCGVKKADTDAEETTFPAQDVEVEAEVGVKV